MLVSQIEHGGEAVGDVAGRAKHTLHHIGVRVVEAQHAVCRARNMRSRCDGWQTVSAAARQHRCAVDWHAHARCKRLHPCHKAVPTTHGNPLIATRLCLTQVQPHAARRRRDSLAQVAPARHLHKQLRVHLRQGEGWKVEARGTLEGGSKGKHWKVEARSAGGC